MKFFHKKDAINSPRPLPSWEETVKRMYDKQLAFVDSVVEVVYSEDKERRYVITQNRDGLLCYHLEKVYAFDEEEWRYIGKDAEALPGYWSQDQADGKKSVFNSMHDLWKDLKSQPEYRLYFRGVTSPAL